MPRKVTSLILCSLLLLGLASCGGDDPDEDSGASGEPSEQPAADDDAVMPELAAALKNAATAQEVHATSTGTYTNSVDDLVAEGAQIPPGVELIVAVVDRGRYFCIEALSEDGSAVMSIESGGVPAETPCEPGEPGS